MPSIEVRNGMYRSYNGRPEGQVDRPIGLVDAVGSRLHELCGLMTRDRPQLYAERGLDRPWDEVKDKPGGAWLRRWAAMVLWDIDRHGGYATPDMLTLSHQQCEYHASQRALAEMASAQERTQLLETRQQLANAEVELIGARAQVKRQEEALAKAEPPTGTAREQRADRRATKAALRQAQDELASANLRLQALIIERSEMEERLTNAERSACLAHAKREQHLAEIAEKGAMVARQREANQDLYVQRSAAQAEIKRQGDELKALRTWGASIVAALGVTEREVYGRATPSHPFSAVVVDLVAQAARDQQKWREKSGRIFGLEEAVDAIDDLRHAMAEVAQVTKERDKALAEAADLASKLSAERAKRDPNQWRKNSGWDVALRELSSENGSLRNELAHVTIERNDARFGEKCATAASDQLRDELNKAMARTRAAEAELAEARRQHHITASKLTAYLRDEGHRQPPGEMVTKSMGTFISQLSRPLSSPSCMDTSAARDVMLRELQDVLTDDDWDALRAAKHLAQCLPVPTRSTGWHDRLVIATMRMLSALHLNPVTHSWAGAAKSAGDNP